VGHFIIAGRRRESDRLLGVLSAGGAEAHTDASARPIRRGAPGRQNPPMELALCGNSPEEATCPLARPDIDGQPLDGSKHAYTRPFIGQPPLQRGAPFNQEALEGQVEAAIRVSRQAHR
jgi:hypothetical protein